MRSSPKDLWSNDETWIVQLWLMNNKDAHEIAKKAAQEAWHSARDDHLLPKADNAAVVLAGWLRESIEANHPLKDREKDMYSEMIALCLERVEWREIARHWLHDIADEA